MIAKLVAAGLGSLLLASLPAVAQEVSAQEMPELDGAPPPLKIPAAKPKPKAVPPKTPVPKAAAPKPAPARQTQIKPETAKPKPAPAIVADKPKPAPPADDKLKAAQVQLAREAEAQGAEKARLDSQAADLKAQADNLELRIALLSAREKGVDDREAALAAQKADLDRQRKDLAAQAAKLAAVKDEDRPETPLQARTLTQPGLDRAKAVEACEFAGDEEARARSFYSAEYNGAPRFYLGETWQVRGQMRLAGRIGYKVVETVCEVDEDGEAQRFIFLR